MLGHVLQDLNPVLRGWANYYRFCSGAHRVFNSIDWYVTGRLWRWMRKKRPKTRKRDLTRDRVPSTFRATRQVWREGDLEQYILAWLPSGRYRMGWMRPPAFALSSGEPDA